VAQFVNDSSPDAYKKLIDRPDEIGLHAAEDKVHVHDLHAKRFSRWWGAISGLRMSAGRIIWLLG
jgi:hypothetical protein